MNTASRTIFATIGPKVLSRAAELFDHRPNTVFSELFQNARRAGATSIAVTIEPDASVPDRSRITITDNGSGIARPEDLLAFGGSGWDSELDEAERAAGMGFWSLAPYGVFVRSNDWQAHIESAAFTSGAPVEIESSPEPIAGTMLSFCLPHGIWHLEDALKREASYLPVPVTCNGKPIEQASFLAGAQTVYDLGGIRIGVFLSDYRSVHHNLNFHGHAISTRLEMVKESQAVANGDSRYAREWYAKIDVVGASDLRLLLPTRNAVVENSAWSAIKAEALKAIYRTIAAMPDHALNPHHLKRARALGIDIAAPRELVIAGWSVTSPDENTWYGDTRAGEILVDPEASTAPPNAFFFPKDLEPQDAAQVGAALKSSALGDLRLLDFNAELEEYPIYRAIPAATVAFEVTIGERTLRFESTYATSNETAYEDFPNEFTLADRITLIVDLPGRDALRIPVHSFVFSDNERPSSTGFAAFIQRDSDPDVVSEHLIDVAWINDDDDDSNARSDAYDHIRIVLRELLLPREIARTKTIANKLRTALVGLIDGTDSRPAVRQIAITYDSERDAGRVCVTFSDGTTYTES